MNLTRITAAREAAIKHTLDSVLPWPLLQSAGSLADIGSGAGFPGIPLAILFPNTPITLVESIQKKARFLSETVRALELPNVSVEPRRGEEVLRHQYFDTLVARALAPLPRLLETLGPRLGRVSRLILYKGPDIDQELEESRTLLQRYHLGCRLVTRHQLPEASGERAIAEFVRLR
jgi:16S rRNA (guanine527-N7)-methyltransferase